MKYPRVLMAEDVQVKALSSRRGTVHGKASFAVAFSMPIPRANRHHQAPGCLNAAY